MTGITQDRRNINASGTVELCLAVKRMEETDFSKYTGSGFNIVISDLKGSLLCTEFTMRGEDMAGIAPIIAKSLKDSLVMRRHLLLAEINSIDKAVDKKDTKEVTND